MTTLDDAAEHGLSGPRRLVWSGVWLAFLGYPIADILAGPHSTGWLIAAWLSLAIFVALYLRTMWSALAADFHQPPPIANGWLAALIVFTFVVVIAFGANWGGMIIYLGVATGASLRNRAALITLTAIAIATVVVGVAADMSTSNI